MENILYKAGTKWTIGDSVVRQFLTNEVDQRYDTFKDRLGKIPQGTDNNGENVDLCKHHVIPREFINKQIHEYAKFVQRNYENDKGYLNSLKNKLNRILNNDKLQSDFDRCFTEEKNGQIKVINLTGMELEVAGQIRDHLTWYPENLFIGPKREHRSDDPGSDLDYDILGGLQCSDIGAFVKFNAWINSKGGLAGLKMLKSKLVTESTSCNPSKATSIIDVLLSLKNNGKGPLWETTGKNNKWVTRKESLHGEGFKRLVLKDLVIPFNTDEGVKKVKSVNIENGELFLE